VSPRTLFGVLRNVHPPEAKPTPFERWSAALPGWSVIPSTTDDAVAVSPDGCHTVYVAGPGGKGMWLVENFHSERVVYSTIDVCAARLQAMHPEVSP